MIQSDKTTNTAEKHTVPSKVVEVDEIVRQPSHFKGYIGVIGKVIKVDEPKAFFVLGCEDACVMMPVRYRGQMPKMKTEIVVYGEIRKTDGGGFLFEGQEIKEK